MTRTEANELGAEWRALMPRITFEQICVVVDDLLNIDDVESVRKRIIEYCSTRVDFDLATARSAIRDKRDHTKRTTEMVRMYANEEQALQERWKADDATLAKLPPAELEQRVEAAMASLPEHIQTVERRRPQLGRLVKDLVIQDLARRF